jgi:RNA-directed DNA polymerase
MSPILSLNDLSSRLGYPLPRLRQIAEEVKANDALRYEYRVVKEKRGTFRHLHVPGPELMDLQRRIKTNILDKVPLCDAVHGGVRGRSPTTNAQAHLGQRCVVKIDVKKFFDRVRHEMVYRLFRRDLGFGRDVARLLTRLTTRDGRLPQGTPTATGVANLLPTELVDKSIAREAATHGLTYTRFVDDITLSGPVPQELINKTARLLSHLKLSIHRPKARPGSKSKLTITPRSQQQAVTGLVVNESRGPSISKAYRDNVRAAIYAISKISVEERDKHVRAIRGKITYVSRTNPGAANRLRMSLESALTGPASG